MTQRSFLASIAIARPADEVFAVYARIEEWPIWTPTVERVERRDDGPLRVGSRALVVQPRLRPAEFTVSLMDPGRRFDWIAATRGLETIGRHAVQPTALGCYATAELVFRGPLAGVAAAVGGPLVRRYLALEMEGLRRCCETPIQP